MATTGISTLSLWQVTTESEQLWWLYQATLAGGGGGGGGTTYVAVDPTLTPAFLNIDSQGRLLVECEANIEADLTAIESLISTSNAIATSNGTALVAIEGSVANIPAKGAATKANSTPVNIASDQTVPVSGTFWQATQPVSGTVGISGTVPVSIATAPTTPVTNAGTFAVQNTAAVVGGNSTAVKVDGSAVTQPVSGTVAVSGTVPVSGTFYQATQPVSLSTAPSTPVTTQTSAITTAATVSTSAYVAGYCLGGLLSFASAFGSLNSGVLQSLTVTSKSVQTTGITAYVFNANPSNSTWTDHATPAINSADVNKLVGSFALGSAASGLGTHTVWTLAGIGQSMVSASSTLYIVLVVTGTPTFAATTDISVIASVLKDG